jgi:DNA modification methylase
LRRLRAGDAFELIDKPEDGSVQLTITSPPFNIGKRSERRLLPFCYPSKTR